MTRLGYAAALVIVLGAIAALSPLPSQITDRGTYERTASDTVVPDCDDLHCFRALVAWTLGAVPGPSTFKWRGYAVVCNAAAAVIVLQLCLTLGVCLKPDFGFIGSVATLVRCRCSLLELNVCHSGSVCRLASAVRRSGGPGLVGALHELGRKPGSSTPWPTESPDRAPGARRSEQRGIGDSCHGSHLADCQGSCIRISTR